MGPAKVRLGEVRTRARESTRRLLEQVRGVVSGGQWCDWDVLPCLAVDGTGSLLASTLEGLGRGVALDLLLGA